MSALYFLVSLFMVLFENILMASGFDCMFECILQLILVASEFKMHLSLIALKLGCKSIDCYRVGLMNFSGHNFNDKKIQCKNKFLLDFLIIFQHFRLNLEHPIERRNFIGSGKNFFLDFLIGGGTSVDNIIEAITFKINNIANW